MKPTSVFFLCFLMYSCGEDSKKANTIVKSESKYEVLKDSIPATSTEENDGTGVFTTIQRDTIRAKSAGFIDWMRPNKKVRKGEALFSYDNYEAFNTLHEKKKSLKAEMDALIESANGDLNYVKPKWKQFNNSLRTDTLLPKFPKIEYKEEGLHFGNDAFTRKYNEIAELENKMKSDFVTSPDDYALIKWKVKKGTRVRKGQIVAVCTPHDSLLVTIRCK
jgi:hypothetical protein